MSNLLEQASLVMIPSGYKEDVVYSEIPLDGSGDLQFTRASNGTRINSEGLVEVVPWNLLLNTDTFSSWNLEGGTLTSGFTAPDGSSTAYKYVQIPGGGLYSGSGGVTADVKFAQVWIKSVSGGSITCNISDGSAFFGTLNVTGEWQLFTAPYTANSRIGLYLYSISNASGIYVWHPQVNIGSTAKPYFPTTDRLNVPRLTYQNGGGGCPSLLLEKQSTNVFVESENLFTTHLVQNLTTSGYSNIATSPDGTQNADKFVPNSTSGVHGIANGSLLTITSGQAYSFSAFVKSDGGAYNLISLTFDSATAWGATKSCIFDASTGASYQVPSGATMSSQSMGNGWYRITATLTATGTVSSSLYQYRIYIADANGNLSWAASSGNTSGIFVWGAQLEASSYPTSYIPTTSASATRVADACFKTGISSLIGQTEGTLFAQFNKPIDSVNAFRLNLSDGTANNWIFYGFEGLSFRGYIRASNSVILSTIFSGTANVNKIAIAYKSGDYAIYHNGTQIVTGSSSFTFNGTLSQINVGENPSDDNYAVGQIAEILVSKTRLTNAELASLTTI